MSYQDLETALELAKQLKHYRVKGEISDDIISKAETLLGVSFSCQTREFLKSVGYLSFSGHEFFGICKDDFSGIHHGNIVESTLADRKIYGLPHEWLTVYFFDDGYYGYLNYGDINGDGEPSVIMAIYNGEKYEVVKQVASDFGEFLLTCVENSKMYERKEGSAK